MAWRCDIFQSFLNATASRIQLLLLYHSWGVNQGWFTLLLLFNLLVDWPASLLF